MREHWCSQFSTFKKILHRRIERVDKLSRKSIYLRKILNLDYEFGLHYFLLDLDWKSFGQRFVITLIRYFTGVGFENTRTMNLDYNYYILLDLDLEILIARVFPAFELKMNITASSEELQ